ncbi:MAG: hypothetical protein FWD17_15810, partial [Polyangiaceae bacterium]|nr:hypothetical protein [Polyangiaceae bacterium]
MSARAALLVGLGLSAALGAAAAAPVVARAQPTSTAPLSLRERLGLEVATRLMRSTEPDERLRGVERIAATHTPEALSLLLRASASTGTGNLDPRLP